MAGKRGKMFSTIVFYTVTVLAVGAIMLFCKGLGGKFRMDAVRFHESDKPLDNPNRGFYHIYKFVITNTLTDYKSLVPELYQWDTDTNLTLVEICLQNYQEREISEAGLENIEALFDALKTVDKQLIVRFVYDLEGNNMLSEPQSLDIILRHMEQTGPVLCKHSGHIFVLQGLFVGNWGEMHGSKYLQKGSEKENLRRLAEQIEQVTDNSTYLAVRTPVQWRMIVNSSENRFLNGRLGLFNDGMLADQSDYGTYAATNEKIEDPYEKWNREDELSFQEGLCKNVPNGGEVVLSSPYNDLEHAIEDMAAMHVTYINRDYDAAVLKKWAGTAVAQESCFNGMDGLTYIERHLGYRLLIEDVSCEHQFGERWLRVNIAMKNTGFASVYREPVKELKLYEQKTGRLLSFPIEDSLRELCGGNEADVSKNLCAKVDVRQLSSGNYTLYLMLTDSVTGKHIQLANEEEEETHGYRLGELTYR